ncbi:hypothetical protein GGI02_005456, partial [Coemansia sp. RSA 2322]
VLSGEPSAPSAFGDGRGAASASLSRYDRPPMPGDMRASPQQPQPPVDLAPAGPAQVIDEATFFMRFNMFTTSAAYTGAYIHLLNLKLAPRWELAIRQQHSEAVASVHESASVPGHGGSSALFSTPSREMGGGALQMPPPPCAPDQAREGVKPLLRILDDMSPYWRVSKYVDRIRTMWRETTGTADLLPLPSQTLSSPLARIPGPVTAPPATTTGGTSRTTPSHHDNSRSSNRIRNRIRIHIRIRKRDP